MYSQAGKAVTGVNTTNQTFGNLDLSSSRLLAVGDFGNKIQRIRRREAWAWTLGFLIDEREHTSQ